MPIGTPGYRVHCATLAHQRLYMLASGHIPELDDIIIPTTGKREPIRREDHTEDDVSMQTGPEQGTALHIPQFDGAIPASTGERAFIRAKGERKRIFGMSLPDQMQALASFAPDPH